MKYLIIGASAAGLAAAKTLRSKDSQGEITVITMDREVHSRCMLHHYLGHVKTREQLNFVPEDFFKKNRIEIQYEKQVTQIIPPEKTVVLSDGSRRSYDKLLIASGASFVIPPIPNLREGKNCYGFRDFSDAKALDQAAFEGARCVVIGSGLVGLDAAYALTERKVSCEIVEMADRISPLQLDKKAGAAYQTLFEEAGCAFHLSDGVTEALPEEDGRISAIRLKSGKVLPCDFVVIAAGVRPNLSFLEGSDIAIDRAVTVDESMKTNVPEIWAAGDVTGIAGIWIAAAKQGELAAKSMWGEPVSYSDRFGFKNTMHFFDLNTLSVGKDDGDTEGEEVIVRESRQQYEIYKLRDGVLTYALIQGDISNKGILEQLVKRKVSLKGMKKPVWNLNYGDFYQYQGEDGTYSW